MCINIVEVSWKAKLKQAFPDPNSYSAFMGNFSSATGAVTLVMMLLGRTIFQKFGWRIAALVTPFMLGVTGLGFFATNLFGKSMEPVAALVGLTPLMLSVILGAAQNIMSKSSKYSLFDPCKEMAYIPLDQESKTKGKAAIDVIGNPLGKSGGALVQQILIFGVGSLAAATPYLAVILAGLVAVCSEQPIDCRDSSNPPCKGSKQSRRTATTLQVILNCKKTREDMFKRNFHNVHRVIFPAAYWDIDIG